MWIDFRRWMAHGASAESVETDPRIEPQETSGKLFGGETRARVCGLIKGAV